MKAQYIPPSTKREEKGKQNVIYINISKLRNRGFVCLQNKGGIGQYRVP